ncbi:DUF4244 domain-containing protein [uncultured Pseudokineococcus sp.]|uniref:DUF4244 domain-containing protein n=1 Tax=uncultured Pseudokineococcus sp. TaxID=1642928 RepID=UPI0026294B4E|nr:DUF4244 domain-containing protein [uncultured Pseudokineococcus sp.]
MSASTRTSTRHTPRPRALGRPDPRRCAHRRAVPAPARACTARGTRGGTAQSAAGPTPPARATLTGSVLTPSAGAERISACATGVALEPLRRPRGDVGMATAEYAVATLAACGFAGLLVALLASGEVRGLLLAIIQRALTIG